MNLKVFAAMALVFAGATACDKGTSKEEAARVAVSSLSPSARASALQVLSSYEDIRSLLARDAVAGLPALAERLEKAASELASSSPASIKPHASAVIAAARSLRTESDLQRARMLFGEISRQVVSLLVIEPSLRDDRHIYECPMAQGYKKWVQPKEGVENPYMGKAMLQCGNESQWTG